MRSQRISERTLKALEGHEIETKPIDWLWQPWLARGVVVVLDGDPGVGKSSLTMDLVGRITSGRGFPIPRSIPDDEQFVGQTFLSANSQEECLPHEPIAIEHVPRHALVVALEDPLDRVVAPRLLAAGADLSKVVLLGDVKEVDGAGEVVSPLQLPRDLDLIADQCRRRRPVLLVIDPFFAVLGYDRHGHFIKANDDQSVRRLTSQLKTLAEEFGMTILLVRHLNKGSGGSAIKRGSGSIAIAGQARSVLLAAHDPDTPDAQVLAMVKTNLAARPRSWSYRVVGSGGGSRIEWLGASDLAADDLIQSSAAAANRSMVLDCAIHFLKATLSQPPMESSWADLVRLAAVEGISEITLRRARAQLDLRKRSAGKGKWVWQLPLLTQLEMR